METAGWPIASMDRKISYDSVRDRIDQNQNHRSRKLGLGQNVSHANVAGIKSRMPALRQSISVRFVIYLNNLVQLWISCTVR